MWKVYWKSSEAVMSDIPNQLRDYRLTTAEIIYHLPDHPDLLQSFTWQTLDIAPKFPAIRKFLAFWKRSLDGKLHSVRIANVAVISQGDYAHVRDEYRLH